MTGPAELAIRLRRAAFNSAIAEADPAAIGAVVAPDIVMVTGSDSFIVNGRKAQLQMWKRIFAEPERTIYTRMPDSIIVSPTDPIAMEHGRWQGVNMVTGTAIASGDYSAKWREIGGVWVIEAELYLTLAYGVFAADPAG